jgi:hypothetical protein
MSSTITCDARERGGRSWASVERTQASASPTACRPTLRPSRLPVLLTRCRMWSLPMQQQEASCSLATSYLGLLAYALTRCKQPERQGGRECCSSIRTPRRRKGGWCCCLRLRRGQVRPHRSNTGESRGAGRGDRAVEQAKSVGTTRGEPMNSKLVFSALSTEDILIANESCCGAPSLETENYV